MHVLKVTDLEQNRPSLPFRILLRLVPAKDPDDGTRDQQALHKTEGPAKKGM